MDDIVVIYNEEPVLVSREVAVFLEQERKREQAAEKTPQQTAELCRMTGLRKFF